MRSLILQPDSLNFTPFLATPASLVRALFLAGDCVYDKKLLWRANLYLDEGDDDWNITHPWNNADNEWNKVYTFQQNGYNFNGFLAPAANQSGRQVLTPYSFTWMRDNNYSGTVAYEFNGQDNPFEFNFKMDNQQRILKCYYEVNGKFKGTQGPIELIQGTWAIPNPLPNPPWTDYTAPGKLISDNPLVFNPLRDHSSYMHPYEYPHGYGNQDPDARKINTSDPLTANNYRPYVPALSMSYYPQNGGILVNDGHFAGWSAGTDCVAFVEKSAGYSGSPYTWFNIAGRRLGTCLWGDSRGATQYPHIDGACWTISHNIDIPENLDKVVPGDILYYGTNHIALVRSIEYEANSRTTLTTKIYLIESVYGNNFNNIANTLFGQVVNYRNVDSYAAKDWVIARLKIN
jgi:hypothetical protein